MRAIVWMSLAFATLTGVFAGPFSEGSPTRLKKCVQVHSYQVGYDVTDREMKGLLSKLANHCTLETFFMDAKQPMTAPQLEAKSRQAKAFVDRENPDVLIIAEDIAAKNVLVPYFKNNKLPVVFMGINWPAEKYGLPFKNITGQVEIAPVPAVISAFKKANPEGETITFLSADTDVERIEYDNILRVAEPLRVKIIPSFVSTFAEWKKAYVKAQSADFIVFMNNAGISDWSDSEAIEWVKKHQKRLTASTNGWMIPLVAFTMEKDFDEIGEWAGEAAVQILAGKKPSAIPLAFNHRFHSTLNPVLLELSGRTLPSQLRESAKEFHY